MPALASSVPPRRLLPAALAVVLAAPSLAHGHAAAAPTAAPAAEPAAAGHTVVLTLEGPEEIAGPLTGALYEEFVRRKVADPQQEEMSLVELRMTMGCEGNDAACLAQGGEALGAASLVYGAVKSSGTGGYDVSLTRLDVASRERTASLHKEIPASELEGDSLRATAAALAAELLGETPPRPAAGGGDAAADTPAAGGRPKPSGELVWGPYKPVPTWKYAVLGTSAALLAGSVVTAAVTSAMIAPNGPVRDDLLQAARDSLDDANPNNDVDPNMSGDLCDFARTEPTGEPGKVTNAAVTKVCNRADTLAKVATATWITTGIFAATTVASTVLLFVHRKAPGEHAFRLGGAASREGAYLSASMRF